MRFLKADYLSEKAGKSKLLEIQGKDRSELSTQELKVVKAMDKIRKLDSELVAKTSAYREMKHRLPTTEDQEAVEVVSKKPPRKGS
mmetsp:Transcript_25701/g.19429  ORF Transcript_25701/g.19429 Transcript_25701/m.19429 type:complete len:86 (+) Transcript_25701:1077-1334(+)